MEVSSQLHALTTLPLEKDPKTQVTGGCVGPGASVDGFWDKQILPVPGFQTQIDQPTTSPYTHCTIPAPMPCTKISKMLCIYHMTKIKP
jgi:hypothetical protein